jgi:hypothetical protein
MGTNGVWLEEPTIDHCSVLKSGNTIVFFYTWQNNCCMPRGSKSVISFNVANLRFGFSKNQIIIILYNFEIMIIQIELTWEGWTRAMIHYHLHVYLAPKYPLSLLLINIHRDLKKNVLVTERAYPNTYVLKFLWWTPQIYIFYKKSWSASSSKCWHWILVDVKVLTLVFQFPKFLLIVHNPRAAKLSGHLLC